MYQCEYTLVSWIKVKSRKRYLKGLRNDSTLMDCWILVQHDTLKECTFIKVSIASMHFWCRVLGIKQFLSVLILSEIDMR